MGFSGIYLTPVLMGNSNHKYDTVDYNQIDPDFGTEQEFIHLIQKAHEMGIRVMIDAVFNHVSRDFMPWADVMEKGKESKYFDWFFINKFPISKNHDASYHGDYYTFAFVDAMPKLNTNNPEVVDYLLNLTKHWTKVWKIDGIRFDVGNEIAHSFIKTLHYELKKINPDIFLLGEIWHNAFPWLLGDEYDSVMNYPFLSNMNNFWDNKQLNATDFKYMINKCYSLYYKQVNRVLFNMLDSHDTARLFQRCKQDENLFYQQLSILMTMQGTPSIYYGTEIEMIGEGSKENRKCMPWDDIEKGVYQDKIDSLRQLIAIRNKYPQARSEQIRWYTENTERLIHYSKQLEGYEELDVYINASDQAVQISREVKTIYSRGVSDSKLMPGGVMIQTK